MALGFSTKENLKRRREISTVLFLALVFFVLTWIEFRLLGISQKLPFVHSIFFFGLVNFNIVILLLLFFLVFRNVVKVFVERKGKVIGSSLKGKLIAAFVAFTTIPTILMFIVSVFYINSSFDKWFSLKMAGVLKNSLEVTTEYYTTATKKNYHFAIAIAHEVAKKHGRVAIERSLKDLSRVYSVDAVEYYPDLFSEPIYAISGDESLRRLPRANLDFLQKGIKLQSESSMIHPFGEGNLVRVIVPVKRHGMGRGAVVVSSFVPLSLISKIDDISSAYEDFRNANPLEYPLKSIYLIILALMTLVILLCGTWFGVHLAKQLSIPLETLGEATQRVSQGDYRPVDLVSGSAEMNQLIANFNKMTGNLDQSEHELMQANANLRETLARLDEHNRYIEVVLGNVSTGVISVDQDGRITTINRYAAQLLNIDSHAYLGQPVKNVLNEEYYRVFTELLRTMKQMQKSSLQQEVRVQVNGRSMPMQMNLSILHDENQNEIGKVLVFDDLTMLVNAQRAAAWTEVARRIAHEIKNPLTPIKLSAQRLQKKFAAVVADPVFQECTSMIIKQTDEMKNLVNEFSNFARLPQSRPIPGPLNAVIQEALTLFRASRQDIEFDFQQDSELPEFSFDPEQMKRVFVNLIDNAVAAVDVKPKKTISIKTQYDSLLKIVRIIVADNGIGIGEMQRDQIFEPYFSTKKHGTGLGLSIVKRIVEDHNGFIRAVPNQPEGLKILVELPVVGDSLKLVAQNREGDQSWANP